MSQNGSTPVLLGLDPDLPFLASKAAVELDTALLGKPSLFENVKVLALRLCAATEKVQGTEDPGTLALLDSPTVEIFSRALGAAKAQRATTLAELISEAWTVANQLSKATTNTENPDQAMLQTMRSFCVALSQSAASYQQSIHDREPRHPYRS